MTQNTQKKPQGFKGWLAFIIALLSAIAGAFSEHWTNCIGNF